MTLDPSDRDRGEDHREVLARLQQAFAGLVPYNQALGLELVDFVRDGSDAEPERSRARAGAAVMRLPYRQELAGNPETGVLHGGVVTALLDATAGSSVFAALPSPTPIATLDLRIDYLKPATPGRDVFAWADCFKVTKNVAFVRGSAFHGVTEDGTGAGEDCSRLALRAAALEDPIAAATATFMLSTRGPFVGVPDVKPPPAGADTPAAARPRPHEAPVLALLEEARRTGDFGPLVDAIPFARFLGLSVVDRDGELVSKVSYAPSLVGNPAIPALHGGAVGALLESAAIFELLSSAESIVLPKTITMTIDYLRSAGAADLFAKAVITKHGRRVASVRVSAWQEDRSRPVATADAHLLVISPEG